MFTKPKPITKMLLVKTGHKKGKTFFKIQDAKAKITMVSLLVNHSELAATKPFVTCQFLLQSKNLFHRFHLGL